MLLWSCLNFCSHDTVLTWHGSIWPIDISYQHPEAAIDALDISLDQCPPQQWLPSNISIRKFDIYSALPADLVEKYDIVNVRLFLCVVRNNDPLPVLKNLLKMLSQFSLLAQWPDPSQKAVPRPLNIRNRAWRISSMVRAQLLHHHNCCRTFRTTAWCNG